MSRLPRLRGVAAWGVLVLGTTVAEQPLGRLALVEKPIPAGTRSLAPDFTLPDVNGKPITLSRYRRRVVLLDFWATTCGGCKVELPWYVEFKRRYEARGLSLIGLDMYGESPAVVKPFRAKWHMDYPVAIGSDALGERYGLREMPLTVLIDRRGRIALSHAGVVEKKAFEAALRQLLLE